MEIINVTAAVKFPSPRGDVVSRQQVCEVRVGCEFPSPRGDVVSQSSGIALLGCVRFRPLAGMW